MSDSDWQQFANEINGRFEKKKGFISKKARAMRRGHRDMEFVVERCRNADHQVELS